MDSLLGNFGGFLFAGLLLFLVLFVTGDLRHHFKVLELVDEEGSHDSVLNLSSGKVSTVGSGDGFVTEAHSLHVMGSTSTDTVHAADLSLLHEEVNDESAT